MVYRFRDHHLGFITSSSLLPTALTLDSIDVKFKKLSDLENVGVAIGMSTSYSLEAESQHSKSIAKVDWIDLG